MERNTSEDNEILSSPSSPEFLLPAFENSLQLSSSPILDQVSPCADEQHATSERPSPSRLRRFSRGQTGKKATRSPSITSPKLELPSLLDASDIRKFKKAEQRLTQSAQYLSKKYNTKNSSLSTSATSDATFVVENDIGESSLPPISTPTSPLSMSPVMASATSPNTTPSRRSRLARAFASSPIVSPNLSPSSPRTPQATPRTRSARRWSQALHAIMSPSPSLPRTSSPSLASVSDIAWAEATNSSPNVSSTEVSRWEMTVATESTRSAQGQLLKTIRELVAKLDNKPLEEVPEMKECVLFLAQFMHCGGRVPDVPALNEAFDKVHIRAVKLCRSLARLRNKELSLDVFEGRFKQAAILCHCLSSRKETETDVFGLKSPLTKYDIHLPVLLRHFVSDYVRFSTILREYHTQYRLERRAKRRERRLARIDKAALLFSVNGQTGHPASPEEAEIAALSTQELLQHALKQALSEGLYTTDDLEAFDPRLMLTLPRLALFYGVRQSAFPTMLREGEPHTVPTEVFLPRVCRSLPYTSLLDLKKLDNAEADMLAGRLAGVEATCTENVTELSNETNEIMDHLFRIISMEADAGTSNTRDQRSNKLLSRALALHISEKTEDFSMDDESTISKAYIMLMGLAT